MLYPTELRGRRPGNRPWAPVLTTSRPSMPQAGRRGGFLSGILDLPRVDGLYLKPRARWRRAILPSQGSTKSLMEQLDRASRKGSRRQAKCLQYAVRAI